jgi:hypothetical protein
MYGDDDLKAGGARERNGRNKARHRELEASRLHILETYLRLSDCAMTIVQPWEISRQRSVLRNERNVAGRKFGGNFFTILF